MSLPRRVLPNQTYLVTRRCIGRRFLLRPDHILNRAFLYCLAKAASKYRVSVHAFCAMSNHYHLVLTDTDGVLPDFMAWFNRQLAMCVKRLRGWEEVVWEPNVPYSAVELAGPKEVLDKVAYTLLNPVSAALVRSPEKWPGAISTWSTLRTGAVNTSRPPLWFRRNAIESLELELVAPPCFSSSDEYLRALDALLQERQVVLGHELGRQGRAFLGARRVRKTSTKARPATKKARLGRSPTFSALTRAAWRTAVKRLRAFRLAYRTAYRIWRDGDRNVEFPAGTWWLVRRAGASAAS